MHYLALTKATIIDCTGSEPRPNGWLVIEGNRIKEVGQGSPGNLPEGTRVIDCKGQTLLPGLIDAHLHITALDIDEVEQQRRYPVSTVVVKALKNLKETLDQGFTSARDCAGADPGFRQCVADGMVTGPRLSVSGSALSQTGGHGDMRMPNEPAPPLDYPPGLAVGIIADGVGAVRWAVRQQLRRGVDFIKVMASGGAASPADELDTSQFSLEELQAAVFEAESAGKYVAAHAYSDRAIKLCCQAGVKTIEHGNFLTESSAQAMKEAGSFLVPTMATYVTAVKLGPELGMHGNFLRKMKQALEKAEQSISLALAAGVKIGSGSDVLGPMQRHKGLELELQARIMGPMGALVAATRTNAEILRQDRNLGTLEAGKWADLILVKGDPLTNMNLFQNFQENITLIIQDGEIYKSIL